MALAVTVSSIKHRFISLDGEARSFVWAHAAGGGAGLFAGLLWLFLGELAGWLDWLVLLWLTSPAWLAALAMTKLPMRLLQALSTFNAIALLSGLAALSGGTASLFLPWLLLVPVEAALSRRPLTLAVAMTAGAVAILILGSLGASGALPAFALPAEWSVPLTAASLTGCLIYAGMLAFEVRAVHARAARRAADSEASYRFLADNAADPILRLSAMGGVLYASRASVDLLHRSPSDIVGRGIGDLVHPDDLAAVQRALLRAGYFGEEASVDCRARVSGAEPTWIELKCKPVERIDAPARTHFLFGSRAKKSQTHQPAEVIAIARDVTRRRQHEESLKRAVELADAQSRAKSRFLANMSHELRTPLNSILGFSEMIAHEYFGPLGSNRYNEYASLIGESGHYLLDLINDILDVAKIEAGKYELSYEQVNIAQTLERTLKVMMAQFREKGVQLTVDVPDELPAMEADSRAIRQILFNLLSNALKFTPEKGKANVRLSYAGETMVIEISDSGIGISEADMKRLARPFEQVNSSYARGQVGTGLGLSLVKSLAALHGGTLSIKSKLGYGTTMSVRLPVSRGGLARAVSEAA